MLGVLGRDRGLELRTAKRREESRWLFIPRPILMVMSCAVAPKGIAVYLSRFPYFKLSTNTCPVGM